MNDGKMPENMLKRSVLGRIKEINKDVITGAAFGKDCAILNCKEKAGIATGTAIGIEEAEFALYNAANNLLAEGYKAKGFSVSIVAPIELEEQTLKEAMDKLVSIASSMGAQIIGGSTEASSFVNKTIVSITAFGDPLWDRSFSKNNINPGDKIIVTKWIGIEGGAILVRERKEELTQRFGREIVGLLDNYSKWISVEEEALVAINNSAIAMKDVSERGIFGALWELGSASNRGLKVDLKAIPIRQEIIEVCNYLNINPYALKSQGMLIIVAKKSDAIIENLRKLEIPCQIIGEFTDNNDRVVINEEEIRHLDKIKQDEIYKLL